MDRDKQRQIVEALILAAPEPISAARLAEILPYGKRKRVTELVRELNEEYEAQGRAFEAGLGQIRVAEFTELQVRPCKGGPLATGPGQLGPLRPRSGDISPG